MTVLNKLQHIPVEPSIVTTPAPSIEQVEPQRHRWTPDDVYKMLKAGILVEGRGCELIDGELFDMASQYNPHAIAVTKCSRLILAAFDESWWITIQSTVRLPRGDMPEPDLAVRPGPAKADADFNPLPFLTIEVSDTTLLYDQIVKSSLYAANGIQEYWVVNLIDRHVEVYRNPIPDAARGHGFRYATINTFAAGTKVSPLAAPQISFEVNRMLP